MGAEQRQSPGRDPRGWFGLLVVWVLLGSVFVGCGYLMNMSDNNKPPPPPNVVNVPVGGGFENPAPGNDGSYDCPPGGGPVYVGSSDPAGLDGDGDGIGCE